MAEEDELLGRVKELLFKPFEFHGFLGNRRVVSFGWRYDYPSRRIGAAPPLPSFLIDLRAKVANAVDAHADDFPQALVTEYAPGAGIGWHRDKAVFGEVIAVSLLSPCLLRLRRRVGERWERRSLEVQPRSLYVLKDAVRSDWEHSIPALLALRYSITFRSLARSPARA